MVKAHSLLPILGVPDMAERHNLLQNVGPFQYYAAFLANKATERSHICTAFPVDFFVSEKML